MRLKLPNYSVLIATYNRLNSLKESLKCVFSQDPLPQRVIVVNASPDFDRQEIELKKCLSIPNGLEFVHKKASRASSAAQRNESIDLTDNEDILFFIDDDSLIYPHCAQEILKVYAQDDKKQIAGVQPLLAASPPNLTAESLNKIEKKERRSSGLAKFGEKHLRFVWRHLFMMASDLHFIPYDGVYHSGKQPFSFKIKPMRSYPSVPLLHGCRMTFRAELVRSEKFDPDLIRYSAAEDLDISYRVSRHGLLLECPDAKLYHEPAASGRLSRLQAIHMASLNIAMFIRKHSSDLKRDKTKYYVYSFRRLVAEAGKDIASKRYSLPQAIGIYNGFKDGLKLLNSSDRDFSENVRLLQNQFAK